MKLAVPVLWLALGGVLSVFSVGRWSIAWAAWLAPVFLLHYSRTTPLPAAMAGTGLAIFLAFAVSHRGAVPFHGPAYLGFFVGMASLAVLPYLADRLLAPRIPGFASTLVFALTWTAGEFLASRVNPFGTWGSVAYTQYGNLPLMQLASVTGIWGITFLVSWFGAVINWAWDRRFEWATIGPGLTTFLVLLSLVVLAGGLRLALAETSGKSVRVAGLGWPDDIISVSRMMRLFAPTWTDAERAAQRDRYRRVQDYFLANAVRAARAGATVILTPENSLLVLREDEPAFLERAGNVARDNGVYLLLGMATIRLGEPRPVEDKAVLIEPSGAPGLRYMKASAVPGLEARTNVRGEWKLPTVDLPFGRVAAPICYDLDFPPLIRQAGRARADLLLVPSADWKEITMLHYIPAVFRAIENGASMVRVSRWGMSGAVDPMGRTAATMDHFAATDRIMVAQVPVKGVRTIYSSIGDTFAWLCVVGLVLLVAYGGLRPFVAG